MRVTVGILFVVVLVSLLFATSTTAASTTLSSPLVRRKLQASSTPTTTSSCCPLSTKPTAAYCGGETDIRCCPPTHNSGVEAQWACPSGLGDYWCGWSSGYVLTEQMTGSVCDDDDEDDSATSAMEEEEVETMTTNTTTTEPEDDMTDCLADTRECANGEIVTRNVNQQCEFTACADGSTPCPTDDIQACPDGITTVSRNPNNGCLFDACPTTTTPSVGCPEDARVCPNGSVVVRDPSNNCEFMPCVEGPIVCDTDTMVCPDGITAVARDPTIMCDFPACPIATTTTTTTTIDTPGDDGRTTTTTSSSSCCPAASQPTVAYCGGAPIRCCPDGEWACGTGLGDWWCGIGTGYITTGFGTVCGPGSSTLCATDILECADGTNLSRDPENGCSFPACPTGVCTQDILECSDGTNLSRDPENSCLFPACPTVCTQDILECPDGTSLSRDPENSCLFPSCPPTSVCTQDILECSDGTNLSRDPANNCLFPACPTVCTRDTRECPDGTILTRDPEALCSFPACPTTQFCTQDVFECPDGTFVGRDPATDCEFIPCPTEQQFCTQDVLECADGSSVSRDPANNCEFRACPQEPQGACTQDVSECPDGSFVSRDPENDCEFAPCPGPIPEQCTEDAFECPDGSFVSRDPENNCLFPACPMMVFCTQDTLECPDGTIVSRDPQTNCAFATCPPPIPQGCARDIFPCPDGSIVSRDPFNNCEFSACPNAASTAPCCPLEEKPTADYCGGADIQCCPDGGWACESGLNDYWCRMDGYITVGGFGTVCAPPPLPSPLTSRAFLAVDRQLPVISSATIQESYASCDALAADIEIAVRMIANQTIAANVKSYFSDQRDFFGPLPQFFAGSSDQLPVPAPPPPAPQALSMSSAVGGESSFLSNNQEAGVDEPDVVKSDGENIWIAYGKEIVRISVASEDVESRTTLPKQDDESCEVTNVAGMFPFPENGRLVVIASGYCTNSDIGPGPIFRSSIIGPGFFGRQFLQVIVHDTANMEIVSSDDIEGSYISARSIDGDVYIISTKPVEYYSFTEKLAPWRSDLFGAETTEEEYLEKAVQEAESNIGDFVKQLTDGVECGSFSKLALFQNVPDFVLPPYGGVMESISTVYGFNIDSPSTVSTKSLILPSSYWEVYASGTHLVLAAEGWNLGDGSNSQETYVITYRLADGEATTRSLGSVPGYVLNQFSMSHMNKNGVEYLFLATSDRARWDWIEDPDTGTRDFQRVDESTSQLTVLEIPQGTVSDTKMPVVSSLEGLGKPGERIYSVRFQGNRVFIVTFEETDPFYTIDITNPEAPRVAGELEIPGFSNYLHPIGEDYVLGVGQSVDPDSLRREGLQISIFDVSDLDNPTRVQNFVEGIEGSSTSSAQYEHQAFRYLPESKLLILPLSIYSWEDDGSPGADSFNGFVIWSIDPDLGVERYFSVDHDEVDRDGDDEICYESYGYLPERSLVFTGSLWTMKGQTIRISDLLSRSTSPEPIDLQVGTPTVECPTFPDFGRPFDPPISLPVPVAIP